MMEELEEMSGIGKYFTMEAGLRSILLLHLLIGLLESGNSMESVEVEFDK